MRKRIISDCGGKGKAGLSPLDVNDRGLAQVSRGYRPEPWEIAGEVWNEPALDPCAKRRELVATALAALARHPSASRPAWLLGS